MKYKSHQFCKLIKRTFVFLFFLFFSFQSTALASEGLGDGSESEYSSPAPNPQIGVTSNSGAVTTSIPIIVPPGRRGMQPALSLSYSSSIKNGHLGVGWDISGISYIQRNTKKGVNYSTDVYVAVLGGQFVELIFYGSLTV